MIDNEKRNMFGTYEFRGWPTPRVLQYMKPRQECADSDFFSEWVSVTAQFLDYIIVVRDKGGKWRVHTTQLLNPACTSRYTRHH